MWEDGKSRHKVIATLGTASTVEEKIREIEEKIAPLVAERDEALAKTEEARSSIKRQFWGVLETYHGGMPTWDQITKAGGVGYSAEGCTQEQREYRYAFGGYEVIESPFFKGKLEVFRGHRAFKDLHQTMRFQTRHAETLSMEIDILEARIAKLEAAQEEL